MNPVHYATFSRPSTIDHPASPTVILRHAEPTSFVNKP
jgi:hypothetical protein